MYRRANRRYSRKNNNDTNVVIGFGDGTIVAHNVKHTVCRTIVINLGEMRSVRDKRKHMLGRQSTGDCESPNRQVSYCSAQHNRSSNVRRSSKRFCTDNGRRPSPLLTCRDCRAYGGRTGAKSSWGTEWKIKPTTYPPRTEPGIERPGMRHSDDDDDGTGLRTMRFTHSAMCGGALRCSARVHGRHRRRILHTNNGRSDVPVVR